MKCPHCKYEFEADRVGLLDCPSCGKPVFVRPPRVEETATAEEPAKEAVPDSGAAEPAAEEPGEAGQPADPYVGENGAAEESREGDDSEEALKAKIVIICRPAWEDNTLPWWKRFAFTARDVALAPFRFFATLPDNFDRRPMRYSYIIWLLYFIVTFGMQYYMLQHDPAALKANLPPGGEELIVQTFGGVDKLAYFTLMLFAGSPLWAMMPPYFLALFLQGFLWLFKIDNRGYSQALRVVSYSSTALLLVLIPPIFGAAIMAYLPILSLAIAFAYRSRFMLAFPLAILTTAVGGVIMVDIISILAQLMTTV